MKKLWMACLRTIALFPPQNWLILIWISAAAYFIYLQSPFFYYGYDWDPGDGDVINVIERLRKGLPIYGDWQKAQIMNLYPPLSHYLFAWIGETGVDVLPMGRMINVFLIVATSVVTGLFVQKSLHKERHAMAFGVIAALTQLSAWQGFRAAINFRPDPLILFLVTFSAYRIAFKPERLWSAALLCALCFFTKQNGLSIAGACAVYYFFTQRSLFIKYLQRLILLILVPTALLEHLNHGMFLRSIIFSPGKYLGQNGVLSWDHFAGLWSFYFWDNLSWLPLLVGAGLLGAWRRRSRPVFFWFLVWIFDFAYNLQSARHGGAGSPYFWIHWTFACALTGIGAWEIYRLISTGIERRVSPRLVASGVCAALLLILYYGSFKLMAQQKPDNLLEAIRTGQRHDDVITDLIRKDPEAKWISVRAPMSIIHAGVSLDHEMCTIDGALQSRPNDVATEAMVRAMRDGTYRYLQTGSIYTCGWPARFQRAIEDCWDTVGYSEVIFYGSKILVALHHYNGKLLSCGPEGWRSPSAQNTTKDSAT